ncbi:choline dehydrogenase [bacterium]|nr:choline dehydrogenase [bacterium]
MAYNFEQVFDYIVIGAGSSGCVIVNRLVNRSDARVLLLEAGGPDQNPDIHEPTSILKLWGSDLDWKYVTEPQTSLNGRQIMISRGKVLGGCSSLYAMIYIRGNRRDFDHWHFLGNEGWDYDSVLPLFKRSERFAGQPNDYHGVGGSLDVATCPEPTPVAQAFAEAGPALGFGGSDWDFNGEQQENGTGIYQVNVTPDGKRCSTAVAFLRPVLEHKNLTVITQAHVSRILIENGKAIGVEYVSQGSVHQVGTEGEIILSAGAFDSPKLLMLSGIGSPAQLEALDIECVMPLAGVGQNLQDHLLLPLFYRSKQALPLPTFIAEAGLFTHTRPGMSAASPDLQYHFGAGIPAFAPPGFSDVPAFAFVPILVQPQSRGEVRLRSNNFVDPPVLNPNYLGCDRDLDVHRRGIELAKELANTPVMQEFNGGAISAVLSLDPTTQQQEIKEYIRDHVSTVWHPVGTCKMGYDSEAVVDAQLRVHGIAGLRVADASIMPTITSGNTNAACIMIGEKVADLLLPPD